jgi:FAD/FMN-containing dehydrogenase
LYSWNDLARFDRHMGRGYLVAGKLVDREPAPTGPRKFQRLNPHRSSIASLPFINPLTLPALNAVYYRSSRSPEPYIMDLTRALYPAADKTYYFSAYGRAGFIEHQILVPDERMHDYLGKFEALVRRRRQPFGLTSLKLFRGRQKLLHYNGTGVSFSLHLPNRPGARELLDELDELNNSYGVITNLIKDSRLSATTARRQYPELEQFAARLGTFDSRRLFVTALSERMAL